MEFLFPDPNRSTPLSVNVMVYPKMKRLKRAERKSYRFGMTRLYDDSKFIFG